MKLFVILPGVAVTLMACTIAFVLTSAINLPTVADIGIWIVAGSYSLLSLGVGAIGYFTVSDF